MTLISIIISILLEKYLHKLENLRQTSWFEAYSRFVCGRLARFEWMDGPAGVIMVIAPLLILVIIASAMLADIHNFFSFLFGILILSYSLGPKKIHDQVDMFIHSKEQGDDEGAQLHLNYLLDESAPDNESQLFLEVAKTILIQTSKGILSVLFWFAILGPIGALMFRLACLLEEQTRHSEDEIQLGMAAFRLQYILHWIPSRLTALSFAVSGSFTHALDCWHNKKDEPAEEETRFDGNEEILTCIGLSALQLADANKPDAEHHLDLNGISETRKLGTRSTVVWITVIAIMTLAGWVS